VPVACPGLATRGRHRMEFSDPRVRRSAVGFRGTRANVIGR